MRIPTSGQPEHYRDGDPERFAPAGPAPDIVILLLDCMRRDALDEAPESPECGTLRDLRSESVTFLGCIAPGGWTIPSHASLFTGLYPWDHSAHLKGTLTLPAQHQTLAEALRLQGYATGSFSANGLIQPGTGLTRGFERVLWGGDREFLFRFLRNDQPSCRALRIPGGDWYDSPNHKKNEWTEVADVLRRSVGVVDTLNRVGAKVLRGSTNGLAFVAPWIEPALREWLAGLPEHKPMFAFVNLVEAHEPYLAGAGFPVGFREWLHACTMVNAPERWLLRGSHPRQPYLDYATHCYRRTIAALDLRVARIVRVLRECKRWRNTVFILTSDHGQSFWERGRFGHRAHLDESICRIPLWIRMPGTVPPGHPIRGWASLIDVARTAAALAGRKSFGDPRSVDLTNWPEQHRAGAVYSFSDGVRASETEGLKDRRRQEVDRLVLAAYHGSSKTECSLPGAMESFRVSMDDPRREVRIDERSPDATECRRLAVAEFNQLLEKTVPAGTRGVYGRRLMAWGY